MTILNNYLLKAIIDDAIDVHGRRTSDTEAQRIHTRVGLATQDISDVIEKYLSDVPNTVILTTLAAMAVHIIEEAHKLGCIEAWCKDHKKSDLKGFLINTINSLYSIIE